jgi:hypothetical protein
VKTLGVPVTDTKVYAMTIGGATSPPSKGTIAWDKATWHREGQHMVIRYQYYQSTAGASAGSGTYKFPLPAGYTIDGTDIIATADPNVATNVGSASAYHGTSKLEGHVYAYDSTNLALHLGSDTLTYSAVGSGFAALNVAPAIYSFTAKVPIVGWSSSAVMSDSTETRVVAFRANTTATTAIGAEADFLPATTVFDTHGAYSSSTGYTIKVPGKYRATAQIMTGTFATASLLVARIHKNGSTVANATTVSTTVSGQYTVRVSTIVDCVAGDVLKPRMLSTAGSPALDGTAADNFFEVSMLQGPAQIAANESVSCRYGNTAGTSMTGGAATQIPFATKSFDSHGSWDGTKFTAPVSGKYSVKVGTGFASAAWTAAQIIDVNLRKYVSGTPTNVSCVGAMTFSGSVTAQVSTTGSDTIQLLAGEQIDVAVFHSAATRNLNTDSRYNYIVIERVGNY